MLSGYAIKNIDETRLLDVVEALEACTYPPFAEAFTLLDKQGWRFFPVKQTRGFCRYSIKTITIPCWIFSRKDAIPD